MQNTDSDGLGAGLFTEQLIALGIIQGGADIFSWSIYTDIEARYDMTDLSTMYTSLASQFDGTNYLEIGGGPAQVTAYPMTMLCWFKTSESPIQCLMYVGDKDAANVNQILFISGSTVSCQSTETSGVNASTTAIDPDDGNWHFAGAVFAGTSDRTVYADENTGNNTDAKLITSTYDHTAIGRNKSGTAEIFFTGDIDNAYIFTAALTGGEIAWMRTNKPTYDDIVAAYAAGTADVPDPSNIASAHELDEHTGTRMDSSGNGMHLVPGGVATGVAFVATAAEWGHAATTPLTTPGMSFTASFKTASTGLGQGIASIGSATDNRTFLIIKNDDTLSGGMQSTAGYIVSSSAATCADGAWHFGGTAITEGGGDATDVQTWLDATAATPGTTDRTPDAAYTDIAIASFHPTAANTTCNGTIDNLATWSITLTTAQYNWLRTAGPSGGPATHEDVRRSQHADNPGYANIAAWYKLNEASPEAVGTLVNVHNPGTYDLTTASGGAGPVSATGHVTDLPIAVAGTVTAVAELEDRATEFDGVDQFIRRNSTTFRPTDQTGTLTAWIRTADTATRHYWCSSDTSQSQSSFMIGVHSTGVPYRFQSSNGSGIESIIGAVTVNDGEWHLVIWTSDGSDSFLSVDGSAFSNVGGNGSWLADTLDRDVVLIGARQRSAVGEYFDGDVDEVMYFNAEFSNADASELYNAGVGLLARDIVSGTSSLTSGKIPIHAWPLSKNSDGGRGADVGSVGGITLTEVNSPTDADGIPAGQAEHGLVSLVVDQSGNGNDLPFPTLSMRPEIVAVSDGTGYGLSTDGIDDYGATSAFSGALSQPNTIIVLVDIVDNSADQGLVDGIAAGNEQSLQVNSTGDLLRIDGGTAASTTIGADYGTLHAVVGVFNGAASKVWQDGGAGEVESAGAETMTGVTVGALQDGSVPAKAVYRQVVVNDGEFTSTELDAIGGKWQTDHGITWVAAT